jgi:hypothetical protein
MTKRYGPEHAETQGQGGGGGLEGLNALFSGEFLGIVLLYVIL